jgi:hypothetical protein
VHVAGDGGDYAGVLYLSPRRGVWPVESALDACMSALSATCPQTQRH